MYQNVPFQDLQKNAEIGIFVLKIYHLATLLSTGVNTNSDLQPGAWLLRPATFSGAGVLNGEPKLDPRSSFKRHIIATFGDEMGRYAAATDGGGGARTQKWAWARLRRGHLMEICRRVLLLPLLPAGRCRSHVT
jgi:hypothetical protein